jgi:hypothetical protein
MADAAAIDVVDGYLDLWLESYILIHAVKLLLYIPRPIKLTCFDRFSFGMSLSGMQWWLDRTKELGSR